MMTDKHATSSPIPSKSSRRKKVSRSKSADDATPAYLVSVQEETSDIFAVKGNHPLERIVADVDENFETQVKIDLPDTSILQVRDLQATL